MPAFYLSSLLAFTGGHMVNYAVILYLQEKVGSDLLSGIGFGLSFGTSILFGWFAGVLCDRISPTRVIHAAQALFVLCLAGLWWTDAGASDATRVGWTLFSAFLGGLAWSFVGPARLAPLGQIAPPDKLKPATLAKLKSDVRYVSWIKPFGKGRVFYCGPSHQPESYETAALLRYYLDGLQYALGDLKCDDAPRKP